eukprot:TRINITY_DN6926_c0_g1_i6.p4 TRINITY_DN6926_c0_g1~~TRINITY_DN6926_c0_g1_i6.p4  ORF type:complete len:214 (+),score=-2.60 TRINITY_DN6926_c0_g1_i6:967-1608(+)
MFKFLLKKNIQLEFCTCDNKKEIQTLLFYLLLYISRNIRQVAKMSLGLVFIVKSIEAQYLVWYGTNLYFSILFLTIKEFVIMLKFTCLHIMCFNVKFLFFLYLYNFHKTAFVQFPTNRGKLQIEEKFRAYFFLVNVDVILKWAYGWVTANNISPSQLLDTCPRFETSLILGFQFFLVNSQFIFQIKKIDQVATLPGLLFVFVFLKFYDKLNMQ